MKDLPDRATIQADLAERFWVPCGCGGHSFQHRRDHYHEEQGWSCQGSGRRYPFRAECLADGKTLPHPTWCVICHGLGYIYAAPLDTFREAFRAKGWLARFAQEPEGDAVWIIDRTGPKHDLAMVSSLLGLTGMAALEAVAWRTLEEK